MEVIDIESLEQLGDFARQLKKTHAEGAVYGLKGDLGAGKTTLVRLFIEALAAPQSAPRVTSPSFVLHQHYEVAPTTVDHWDLYRLNTLDEESLTELGYPEIREESRANRGWTFVEWPDRVVPRELLGLTGEIRFERNGDLRTLYWNPDL